ncbi:hypothetical protein BD626DRAFT_383429, partial [Schizophyllum amplum]
LVQLAMNISMKSPSAYGMLKEHIQIPELRTLQIIQAKQPRLPIGISPAGADLIREYLTRLRYHGALAISVDDTKILESVDVYRDSKRNGRYFVIGQAGEEIEVLDPEAFRKALSNAIAATKLRLWVLRVTGVPSIPSMIVSSLAITNLDADVLVEHSWSILQLLWERDINVVSYACDGASVERKVQSLLKARATYVKTYTLPHPGSGCADIEITVAHYGDRVLAFIQDPKHALKTARNNVYSGARALLLPNHLITLAQIWQIYFEGGPLFGREVKRPDKQDDNGAGRFGNSDTLGWVIEHHPEHRGLIAYLFIFGEFIDAYQSRTLPLAERVVMLTRGMFFLDMWEKFLDAGRFPKAKHFISHEAKAIMQIIYHGFMEALFIYRDDLGPNNRHPFCPWLFGTDACEHVFGLCRQMVMDFTVLDFWHMIPKLFLSLRRHISHRNTNPRATTSGYNHAALFDHNNLDMSMLSDYSQVTDAHLARYTRQAFDEASSLFDFLGVSVEEIYPWSAGSTARDRAMQSHENKQHDVNDLFESDSDGGSSSDECDYWDSELEMDEEDMRLAKAAVLRKMEEKDLPAAARKRAAELAYAEAGLETDRRAKIDDLPDVDEEQEAAAIELERDLVAEKLADSLPAVDAPLEHSNPFQMSSQTGIPINLQHLVALRRKHETPEAAKASRTRTSYNYAKDHDTSKKRGPTEHQKLARAYAQIAREYRVQSESTGAQRKLRWTGQVIASGGNAQNAVKVADAAATRVS